MTQIDGPGSTPDSPLPAAQPPYARTERTTPSRYRDRATFDRAAVHAVLDEALVAHVRFVRDGAPVVLPTPHARIGDPVYIPRPTGGRAAGGGGRERDQCRAAPGRAQSIDRPVPGDRVQPRRQRTQGRIERLGRCGPTIGGGTVRRQPVAHREEIGMRILVVGAGGVGSAFAPIAARRAFFERIVVADYDASRAEAVVARVAAALDELEGPRRDAGLRLLAALDDVLRR